MGDVNNKLSIDPCLSSNTNEWYTPKALFDELHKEFNFTLDPCCTKESAKCDFYYTKDDDGLSKEWTGETVFVNPPYGREIGEWVKKSRIHGSEKDTVVVMLIPSRTDTNYWHENIFMYAHEIRFLRGRIYFESESGDSSGRAPFPSAVVVFKSSSPSEKCNMSTAWANPQLKNLFSDILEQQ